VLFHARWLSGHFHLFYSGYLAVDFFFCLSGFVIAYAYDDKLKMGMTLSKFLLTRIVRLYPMIFLGTCFAAIPVLTELYRRGISPGQALLGIVASLTLLPNPFETFRQDPNFGTVLFPINNPEWSLFFEIVINLLYATFFRLLTTLVLLPIMIILFVWLLFETQLHGLGHLGIYPNTFFAGIPRSGFSFLVGVLLSRLHSQGKLPSVRLPVEILYLSLAVVLTIDWTFLGTFAELLFVLLLSPVLVLIGCQERLSGWRLRWAEFLGATSYPMYTVHYPLLALFEVSLLHTIIGRFGLGFLAFSVITILAISWLLLRKYDEPVRRQLNNLMLGRSQTPGGVRADLAGDRGDDGAMQYRNDPVYGPFRPAAFVTGHLHVSLVMTATSTQRSFVS
jgi:peptidoglycan/LPS O-acetylase OafA/YrhL